MNIAIINVSFIILCYYYLEKINIQKNNYNFIYELKEKTLII